MVLRANSSLPVDRVNINIKLISYLGFVEWFKKPFTTTPAVLTKDQEGSHTLGLK